MFAVMWSALQQSPRLDILTYWGNTVYLCLFSTLQAVPLVGWIGSEGGSIDFTCSRSAACLPTASRVAFEMHGLLKAHGCLDVDALAGLVFQG